MDIVEVVFGWLLPLSLGVVCLAESVDCLTDLVGSGFFLLFWLDFVGFNASLTFLFLPLVEVVFVVIISSTLAQFGCMGSLVPESYYMKIWKNNLRDGYIALHKKMKFFIKYFFSKCDQIRSFLRIWSHLLKKSLMEKFIFCAVQEAFTYYSLFKTI